MPRQKKSTSRDDRRGGGPRPLAASLGGVAKRALGSRGFAEAGLITGWSAIVGAELAAASQPDRLSFPPGKRDGGTLHIRVAGGMALEMQHLAPQVIERVNGYFGYGAIERIVMVQAPIRRDAKRPESRRAEPPREPDPAELAVLEARLDSVEDPDIRAALHRLGRAVLSDGET